MEGMQEDAPTGTVTDAVEVTPQPEPELPDDGFSGKAGDIANDLRILAKARKIHIPDATTQPELPKAEAPAPAQPPEPKAPEAATTPEIPEKFKTPEGQIDVAKVEKSALHAEMALQKALAKEKELRRKQNEVAQLERGIPQAQGQPQAQPTSLSAQLEQDVKTYGLGPVLERLFVAASEHAKAQSAQEIAAIKEESELSKRQRELELIAKTDPWVLSDEGIDTLGKIRETRPWLNNSPTPWTAAYDMFLADQVKSQRLSGKVQPTPTARTAPATPVQASQRVAPQTQGPPANATSDQITQYVNTLTPEQEKLFWKSKGLRF